MSGKPSLHSAEAMERQQRFDSITFSYLKRHYFVPEALRRRTMEEFARAIHSGRLIAFTGSMTTLDRGYPTWGNFVETCFTESKYTLKEHGNNKDDIMNLQSIVDKFEKRSSIGDRRVDHRVSFSVIGETADLAAFYSGKEYLNPNEAISKKVFLKGRLPPNESDILGKIIRGLSVDRIITLNYDFEAELEYSNCSGKALNGEQEVTSLLEDYKIDSQTGTITKGLPGETSLVSDIFNRERTDRLFEFAIGSPDHEYHVLHLHGRADAFDSMVVSYRDYDRLYRRSGLSKAPFEHAMKLLLGGNPILFIGLGMTEVEVNRTLQDYVGNHPYRRAMPSFLLWNSLKNKRKTKVDQDACDVFRIDMLHRLGIFTIFSHELVEDKYSFEPGRSSLDELGEALTNLVGEMARRRDERLVKIEAWRRLTTLASKPEGGLIAAWEVVERANETENAPPRNAAVSTQELQGRLTLAVGRSGAGKGLMAKHAAKQWLRENETGTALLINADFCFDTDSLLNLIADVIRKQKCTTSRDRETRVGRNAYFATEAAFELPPNKSLLVVIVGMERLFASNGEPLSDEFDIMVRRFVEAGQAGRVQNVGFLLFSTQRTKSYISALQKSRDNKNEAERPFIAIRYLDNLTESVPFICDDSPSRNLRYIACLEQRFLPNEQSILRLKFEEKANGHHALSSVRRAFYQIILDPQTLENCDAVIKGYGELAIDILTVMSHIGQPVEREVLFLTPRIQDRLRRYPPNSPDDRVTRFHQVMNWLKEKELVLTLRAFPYPDAVEGRMERYGLHTTLLTELRERAGVPLSEAALATAFNMSLHTAQPADSPLPEPALHDELGRLIDWLIGAFKDEPLHKDQPALVNGNKPVGNRTRTDHIAALRAALAVVRGFYSTATLLSLDHQHRRITPERDGALTEHAERLERLVTGFRQFVRATKGVDTKDCGPFYPDELVWLYNEIGVVKLAQGSLYEARAAFDEAHRFNVTYVEYDDRSHNWRRIHLNQVLVDIERGNLTQADDQLELIEKTLTEEQRNTIKFIGGQVGPQSIPISPGVSHEEILVQGLVHGYRGICAQIRAKTEAAMDHYNQAVALLGRLDERRALATFERHRASLLRGLGQPEAAQRGLDQAIATAIAVRQLDIVQHCRIDGSNRAYASRDIDQWTLASRKLKDALAYADMTDMYRVRVEARANMALASITTGDFEAALEHATDALTVAVRHGLSLRKASLRVLIGRILVLRGDPVSGRALILAGSAAAARIGYQSVAERATAALQMLNAAPDGGMSISVR